MVEIGARMGTFRTSRPGGPAHPTSLTGLCSGSVLHVSPSDCDNAQTCGRGFTMKVPKRVLLIFLLISAVRTSSSAQPGWFWQNPLPQGNSLYACAALDSMTVVAVGSGGAVIRTSDGGETWTLLSSGTRDDLFGVSFVNRDIGTAVGGGPNNSTIVRTTDGGQTWTRQPTGLFWNLFGVSFVDANIGAAVGHNGTVLRTVNGGETWTRQTTPTGYWLLGVSFVDANIGTVVGTYVGTGVSRAMILRTVDGGATWTPQPSGTAGGLV